MPNTRPVGRAGRRHVFARTGRSVPEAPVTARRRRRPALIGALGAGLATLLVLTGCAATAAPPSSRQPGGPRHAAAGGAGNGASGAGAAGAGAAGSATGAADPGRRPWLAAIKSGLTNPSRPAYYLALGDSLALGIQPTPGGGDTPTARGYPDQLDARLRGVLPRLRLVKLGCSGETTTSMIHGGICRYPVGSQLNQAVRFLRSHRGQVALVTIDIGGNDPNSCVLGAQPLTIPGCLYRRVPVMERNLTAILAKLRSAAGPRLLIAGMTYYVPELGLWRRDLTGRQIAVITASFAVGVNKQLIARYHRAGAVVANVFRAFRSTDFGSSLTKGLRSRVTPPNVAAVCALTWMCAAPPLGPNEHANNAGYQVIANALWRAITR